MNRKPVTLEEKALELEKLRKEYNKKGLSATLFIISFFILFPLVYIMSVCFPDFAMRLSQKLESIEEELTELKASMDKLQRDLNRPIPIPSPTPTGR